MRRNRLGWLGLAAMLIALTGGAITAHAANGGNGWLGIYSQTLTPELRDGLDYRGDGVLVNRVVDGSPAERAGLEKGDIILSVEGRKVDSPESLAEEIQSRGSGETVSIRVIRDGERRTVEARLSGRPDEEGGTKSDDRQWRGNSDENKSKPDVGNDEESQFDKKIEGNVEPDVEKSEGENPGDELGDLPGVPNRDELRRMIRDGQAHVYRLPKMRGRLGIQVDDASGEDEIDHGAKVAEVLDGTPAERAGLRKGDVITRVDSDRIDSASDLIDALRGKEGRVSLEVYRDGERRTVVATLDSGPRAPVAPRALVAPRAGRMHGMWMDDQGSTRTWKDDGSSREQLQREVADLRREIERLRRELEDAKRER